MTEQSTTSMSDEYPYVQFQRLDALQHHGWMDDTPAERDELQARLQAIVDAALIEARKVFMPVTSNFWLYWFRRGEAIYALHAPVWANMECYNVADGGLLWLYAAYLNHTEHEWLAEDKDIAKMHEVLARKETRE